MAEGSSSRKRSFDRLEDDESFKRPTFRSAYCMKFWVHNEKKVRFPKGKKIKSGFEVTPVVEKDISGAPAPLDPHQAAKKRAMRRKSQMAYESLDEDSIDTAEVDYEDNEYFEDGGIKFDPFNLNQEREGGYFDGAGNYVEYVEQDRERDAWLDSAEVDTRYAKKAAAMMKAEEDARDLTSEEIGRMKRRITDLLEPGESVLQALKRLKGTPNKKEKMPVERKAMFDQLTEDAMMLLNNGEYNVYQEKKEVFQREAEGYERLALARSGDSVLPSLGVASSSSEIASNIEELDMFAEDEDNSLPHPDYVANSQPSAVASNSDENPQNDYIYDESSGYYYSSSSGYYYDSSTGLYCSALTGTWYSFNEETGTYDEVQATVPTGADDEGHESVSAAS